MKIVMTDELDGFTLDPINNIDALPHPRVKARKKLITEGELMKYLSKVFAIRIARGAKIFVNGKWLIGSQNKKASTSVSVCQSQTSSQHQPSTSTVTFYLQHKPSWLSLHLLYASYIYIIYS